MVAMTGAFVDAGVDELLVEKNVSYADMSIMGETGDAGRPSLQ
jgi:hypothetical protein